MEKQYSTRPFVFIFRFFSGLRSVQNGIWNPQGAPAIYKLLEHAARQRKEGTVLFFCKTPQESVEVHHLIEQKIKALSSIAFLVVPFYSLTDIRRIDVIVTSLIHFLIAIRRVYTLKPCLIYCDRAHLGLAAIFAWCTRFKVVVRMLGVARLGELYGRRRNALLHPIQYFAIRAPFFYVICSKDGSPASQVLGRFLNKETPYVIWLNGIDGSVPKVHIQDTSKKPIRILFVGRFDQDKGCLEFIEAIKRVCAMHLVHTFTATMVGGGALEREIKMRIARYGLEHLVKLEGYITHHEAQHFYEDADVYVSLNTLGNLSNTVLEALATGTCTVVLKGDRIVDIDTDDLLPEDIVPRVDRTHTAEDFALKLADFLDHPERIQECARRTKILSNTILESWESRIAREWILLENVCRDSIHHE